MGKTIGFQGLNNVTTMKDVSENFLMRDKE